MTVLARQMQNYMRHWQRLLKLTGYNIELRIRGEDQDSHLKNCEAYLVAQMPTFRAVITLNEDELLTWRASIIHELLHLLVREHLYGLIQLLDDEVLGPTFERLEERLVHRLTHALAVLESEVTRLKEASND